MMNGNKKELTNEGQKDKPASKNHEKGGDGSENNGEQGDEGQRAKQGSGDMS